MNTLERSSVLFLRMLCLPVIQLPRGPAGDRFLHSLPGGLQAMDQFVSTASWHPLAIPGTHAQCCYVNLRAFFVGGDLLALCWL